MYNNLPIATLIQDNTIIDYQYDCLIDYPKGLQEIIELTINQYNATYWIVNNSFSMAIKDSYIETKNSRVSRFEELCNALKFHANIAIQFNKHIEFHIMNTPNNFISNMIGPNIDEIDRLSQTYTYGDLSLKDSIQTILTNINKNSALIHARNKKAHVVITVDNIPIDINVIGILNELIKKTFVHVTIRLCTDDTKVIDYWQYINELSGYKLYILNNIYVKINKVLQYNPWFTYCEKIHRIYECGDLIELFYYIDEQPLTISEIHHFSEYLIDKYLPNPKYSLDNFMLNLKTEINKLKMVINPINKKHGFWININKINNINSNWGLILLGKIFFLVFLIILYPKYS